LHGDPFGPNCLYDSTDYSSLDAHPPQIGAVSFVCSARKQLLTCTSAEGISFDGIGIYGRYLSSSASGFALGLDNCGGHTHDSYGSTSGYHYHTQVIQLTTSYLSVRTFLLFLWNIRMYLVLAETFINSSSLGSTSSYLRVKRTQQRRRVPTNVSGRIYRFNLNSGIRERVEQPPRPSGR
jgi:hypothetical protein